MLAARPLKLTGICECDSCRRIRRERATALLLALAGAGGTVWLLLQAARLVP